jgi:hypothetical protein
LRTIVVLFLAISVGEQSSPNFTRHGRQQTNSKTQRQVEIEQKGQHLRVKTLVTNSDGTWNLEANNGAAQWWLDDGGSAGLVT